MKIYIALTDYDWYMRLKNAKLEEVNFWRPGSTEFKALQPDDLFLFKLKAPYNAIVGGGFFFRYDRLPIRVAWDYFGIENGTKDFEEFDVRLKRYRAKNNITSFPDVGCIVLNAPFYLEQEFWITPPADMAKNIVVGKLYDSEIGEGKRIFAQVIERMTLSEHMVSEGNTPNLFNLYLTKHRIGQGAFRLLIANTYNRCCAISGEKTLPVLQAAHIKPYTQNGPNIAPNGILLRTDIHQLFDDGYITITPNYEVRVSERLHKDYGNGKMYYQFNKEKLIYLPQNESDKPNKEFLEWHNDMIFLK